MRGTLKDAINTIVFLIVLYEIAYLVDYWKTMILRNFEIKTPFGPFMPFKLIGFVIALLVFGALCFAASRIFKIHGLLFAVLVVLSLLLFLNHKLFANHGLTDKSKRLDEAMKELKTGDIIIFETPKTLGNYFMLVPVLALNICHIGIVVRDKDRLYVLDSDVNDAYCHYSKRTKNGVMLIDFAERIREYDDSYIIKTNLREYVRDEDLFAFIDKYSDKKYMESGINCMTLILLFLHELKLSVENLFKKHPLFVDYKILFDESIYSYPFVCDMYKLE
jgi:hypothetical protein